MGYIQGQTATGQTLHSVGISRGATPPRVERKALAPIDKLRPKERVEEHVVVVVDRLRDIAVDRQRDPCPQSAPARLIAQQYAQGQKRIDAKEQLQRPDPIGQSRRQRQSV